MNKTIEGLRWYQGKRLIASVRKSDYAHAGEEEAIIKCLSPFPKDKNRSILDVGCGQGGTANFIQNQGWGKVVGLDIEKNSIEYAKDTYPNIEFITSDVINSNTKLANRKFDLICLFNSFYAFPNQSEALKILRSVTKSDSNLIIFEYTDLTKHNNNPLVIIDDPEKYFLPIRFNTIIKMLKEENWSCTKIIDLHTEYEFWYHQLVYKIEQNKNDLISEFSEQDYLKALNRYTTLYEAIKNKILGGCILYAIPD